MRKTRTQLRAEQIAQLQAEQAEHERSVETAMKVAKYARCAVVEELYELLDVRAEHRPRESKNGVIHVSTDKDETKRTARLLETVSQLLAERDGSSVFTADLDQVSPVSNAGAAYDSQSFPPLVPIG